MIAAIYARKSTEQHDVDDEQKSVTRQIDHARAYARRKGWAVSEEHIFSDDGISGAEFKKRPGFVRLKNALKPPVAFQVLIMSEESRLGREAIETMWTLKELSRAGVRVFSYLEDREIAVGSFQDDTLTFLRAQFAADERRKASQRTRDSLRRKALAGHVTGGRVFGYDNVDVTGPDGRRSHVTRQINEAEAAVVRRIFELCAAGMGQARIAQHLNEVDRAIAPRTRNGGPRGWAASTVHEVLFRELYCGRIVWNRRRKRNDWGEVDLSSNPEAEWLRVDAPQLRVVSDEAWNAAHQRLERSRAEYDRATHGKRFRQRDRESKYLMVGFARCAVCNGGISVDSRAKGKRGRLGRAFFYRCSANHQKGPTACSCSRLWPMVKVDEQILGSILGDVLAPDLLEEVVETARAMYQAGAASDPAAELQAELLRVEKAIGHLTEAIAAGGDLPSLVTKLTEQERRRRELAAALEQTARPRAAQAPWRDIERRVRACLTDWRSTLLGNVAQARQAFRKLLAGPVLFEPFQEENRRGVRFTGRIGLAAVFDGYLCTEELTRAGIEPATL